MKVLVGGGGGGDLLLGHRPVQQLLDQALGALDRRSVGVVHAHLKAGLGEHLDNATSHGPRPDYRHPFILGYRCHMVALQFSSNAFITPRAITRR